jgi:hypothetical protein
MLKRQEEKHGRIVNAKKHKLRILASSVKKLHVCALQQRSLTYEHQVTCADDHEYGLNEICSVFAHK